MFLRDSGFVQPYIRAGLRKNAQPLNFTLASNMNILEADYGIGPLIDVEEAIKVGIAKLFERNKLEPWFDGLWMNEYGEVLFGSLLVACQAYCLGCVSDINSIRKDFGLGSLSKTDAYRDCRLSKKGYSAVELINAGANCFKHRDEWGDVWPVNLTTNTLGAFSITQGTEFPLNEIQEIIESEFGYNKISNLVSDWREELIHKAKIMP